MTLATFLPFGMMLLVEYIPFRPFDHLGRIALTRPRNLQLDPGTHVILLRVRCITSHIVEGDKRKRASAQRARDSGTGIPNTGPSAQVEVV